MVQADICKSKSTCVTQVFSKRVECNWTEGYSWRTTLVLSVTLGGFGADRCIVSFLVNSTFENLFPGSTWVIGKKALGSYSALGVLGFGPWLTLFSLPLAILALQTGPFIFRELCRDHFAFNIHSLFLLSAQALKNAHCSSSLRELQHSLLWQSPIWMPGLHHSSSSHCRSKLWSVHFCKRPDLGELYRVSLVTTWHTHQLWCLL